VKREEALTMILEHMPVTAANCRQSVW